MPKREDERQLNLSGKHPVYCTCAKCTRQFLKRHERKSRKGFWQRLFKRSKSEQAKRHPANCTCATCNLLRSVENLPPSGRK